MAVDTELKARIQSRLGTTLRGKYRVDRLLGVGGMAVVYQVTHRNQREFALKMLHPELSLHEDVRSRFLREGYAANTVKHPGVVAVVDDDLAEDGAAFLVMELLDGASIETLAEAEPDERLPMAAVVSMADQLLDVLGAAHDKGIIHRDIKPANLFALRDGTLKVLDFGIARVKDVAGHTTGRNVTGTGLLLGTPAFMAPEQAYAKASEIDGQTDVWAVGATMFTLLTGEAVHSGDNAAQLMVHAATMHARSILALAPDTPPSIAEVVDRALMFDKGARWRTAGAMRAALAEACGLALGAAPRRDALATLANNRSEMSHAPTLASRSSAPPAPVEVPPPTIPLDAEAVNAAVLERPLVRSAGTHAGVESPSLATTRPARSRTAMMAGAAMLVVLGAAATALVGSTGKGVPHAASTPVGGELSASPSAPPLHPLAAAAPDVPLLVAAPEPPSTAPAATTSHANVSPLQLQRPAARRSVPLSSAAPAKGPPPATSATASAPPTGCTPPFTLDDNGEKHWKPECFSR